MNEFSCRVLIGMVEMAEAGGIPRERLLHGFRHSPEHIMNPRNRTDWDIGMPGAASMIEITRSRISWASGIRYWSDPDALRRDCAG